MQESFNSLSTKLKVAVVMLAAMAVTNLFNYASFYEGLILVKYILATAGLLGIAYLLLTRNKVVLSAGIAVLIALSISVVNNSMIWAIDEGLDISFSTYSQSGSSYSGFALNFLYLIAAGLIWSDRAAISTSTSSNSTD